MLRLTRLAMGLLAAGLLVTLLPACGGSGPKVVAVKGKLLNNGQPVKPAGPTPPGDPGVKIELFTLKPDNTLGESFNAAVTPADGTFTVPGAGKGIPPGKYRVSVHVGAYGMPDALKGEFSRDRSPLTVTIPDKAASLTVDVGKKAVTVE